MRREKEYEDRHYHDDPYSAHLYETLETAFYGLVLSVQHTFQDKEEELLDIEIVKVIQNKSEWIEFGKSITGIYLLADVEEAIKDSELAYNVAYKPERITEEQNIPTKIIDFIEDF